MNGGLHHLHMRKRKSLPKCEPFPATTPALRLLDRVMYVVAIVSPLMLMPQALQVFMKGDVQGLSLPTWILLGTNNILWAFYAYVHRDRPVYISSGLVAVIDLAIVIGILKYS